MTPREDVVPFGGKPPRLYYRLLRGERRAWSSSARAARAEVMAELQRHGLGLWLVRRRGMDGDNRYGVVLPLERTLALGDLPPFGIPPAYFPDGSRFPAPSIFTTRWGSC